MTLSLVGSGLWYTCRKFILVKGWFERLDINQFSTIGYFIQCYFNWSVDYLELEDVIEEFLMKENSETIRAFRKEIVIMYELKNPDLFRVVSYRLGDRGISTKKALYVMEMLYTKTQYVQ